MNLINRDTDYAVRALRHMARLPETVFSVSDLAPALHVPGPFLRRILRQLARRGILRSLRGNGGGFTLNRPPSRIRLTDVIDVYQGEVNLARCCFRGKPCPNQTACPLRKTVKEIEDHAVGRLRSTTIAALL